jgi:hypothetical protein
MYRVSKNYKKPFREGPVPFLIAAMRNHYNIPENNSVSFEGNRKIDDFEPYDWVNN